jgi:hypothetical protein
LGIAIGLTESAGAGDATVCVFCDWAARAQADLAEQTTFLFGLTRRFRLLFGSFG